jgi:hypothetical protein
MYLVDPKGGDAAAHVVIESCQFYAVGSILERNLARSDRRLQVFRLFGDLNGHDAITNALVPVIGSIVPSSILPENRGPRQRPACRQEKDGRDATGNEPTDADCCAHREGAKPIRNYNEIPVHVHPRFLTLAISRTGK